MTHIVAVRVTPRSAKPGIGTWREGADGRHELEVRVAETPSAYLGMIERVDDGFVASAADGRDLGRFTSAADARIAVYAGWFRRREHGGFVERAQGVLRRVFAA